jgi:hypothetical protein
MAAETLPIPDFHSATNPALAAQPSAGRVMVGDTLDLFVETAAAGSHTWPDPVWTSLTPSIATVAVVVPDSIRVTGVAVGLALIQVSVAGTVQVFSLDVVAAAPTRVSIKVTR